MALNDPITSIKGVGDALASQLKSLGIVTVADLIEYVPRRYEDYSDITPINRLRPGNITIEARITSARGRYVRRGIHITEAIATDATGSVRLVWFNQPYRAAHLKSGIEYFISGDYSLRRNRFSILNPSVELVSDFPVNTARIIPIYKLKKDIRSHTIRKLVRQALNDHQDLVEHLPDWLINNHDLMSFKDAIHQMHFPSGSDGLKKAKKRLAFEEVFELSLAALLNKRDIAKENTTKIPFKEELARRFVGALPFELTDAQRRAIWQIYQDMQKPHPMNRLLEGDVGSGKTVVAAMAALMAIEQGFQVALMAPTELLASQHYELLHRLLKPIGRDDDVQLLVGGMNPKQKAAAHSLIASGKAKLITGTHALIAEKVKLSKLGLVIIDEQHRFGVDQRKKLQAKAGHMPHVLNMSATPIPRSLALTLYGEMDMSILNELPPGRSPVNTSIVSPNSTKKMYENIESELSAGHQAYIVCPLIEETGGSSDLSVESTFERLSATLFKHRKLALLHGRMKAAEKDKIMKDFAAGKYHILVSTTVIEVGVDVPNASVIVVIGADRFGLAQIHQLRGRVGRGTRQSHCFLVLSDSKEPTARIRALESINDGFKLAELDLKLRGPGAIYGSIQHGALDLRVAKLTDTKLIAAARSAAQQFIDKGEDLSAYPHLQHRVESLRAITNLN